MKTFEPFCSMVVGDLRFTIIHWIFLIFLEKHCLIGCLRSLRMDPLALIFQKMQKQCNLTMALWIFDAKKSTATLQWLFGFSKNMLHKNIVNLL